MQAPRSHRGFTLIELLVVVVIIGIIVSMATLSLGKSGDEQLETEMRRLSALVEMARDEAVLKSRQIGLGFWDRGYQFFVLVPQEPTEENNGATEAWQVLSGDRLLRARELPETIRLELYLQGVKTRLEPNPQDQPDIFILSSGEMMPFEAVLALEGFEVNERRLSADNLGRLSLETRRDE